MTKKPAQSAHKHMTTIPQAQQLTIPQALSLAAQQIDSDQLPQAESILQQIFKQNPKHAEPLHLLGVLEHKTGNTAQAIKFIEKAIKLQPSNPHYHINCGEMCRLLNRPDDAIYHGEQAIKLAPLNPNAYSNLGIAYYDKKDYVRAENYQIKALELAPNLPAALNNLGSIKRDLKDKEGAIEYYRKVLKFAPNYLEARNNLGAVLTELENPEDAITELLQVIRTQPNYADAHCNIGNAFLLLENFDKANHAFKHTLALMPDSASALIGLARIHKETDALNEAREKIDRALALVPDRASAHSLSGDIYTKIGAYEQAELAYKKALSIDENEAGALLGLGQMQMELGNLKDAKANYERVMEIDPNSIAPHIFMVQAKKIKENDESLLRLEAEAAKIDSLPPTRAISLHFALGKAYDDIKEYGRAFSHFATGGRMKRSQIHYDPSRQDQITENIKNIFTPEMIARLRGAGDPSDLPIFVLGMPRSGTTLTETIIASHPDVYGAGELRDLLMIANEPVENVTSPGYPLSVNALTAENLTKMGKRYITALRKHNQQARYITDKMPANFLAVGLIHLMLPKAKIIHVNRNAADTCLSGFNKLFSTNSQYHSYDLTEMGRYYVNYAKLMEHWRAVLPKDAFLEVQYEELVANKESQTRRLIEFCGLEWNDACLESHKTERSIKTASITQVRQPVYTSSVERWRHYEKYLQPLLEALGEYAPDAATTKLDNQ